MKLVIAAIAACALAACATHPVSTADAEPVSSLLWSTPEAGTVPFTVKRDKGLMGAACKTSVYVDGQHVGSLAPSQKLTVYLPPGEHMVGARNGAICGGAIAEAAVTLTADAQKTYRIAIGDAGTVFIQPTAF